MLRTTLRTAALPLLLATTACGSEESIEGYDAFERHVANNRVGGDADHWIEMQNMAGQWERTGLIFGYLGDYDECQKAIAGLKAENDAREYRCVPAN